MRRILQELGIRPKKSLGQSFLTQRGVIQRVVAAADISPDEVVIEVGPGLGILTEALASTGAKVVAVELDSRLIPYLRSKFASSARVEIVHGDILQIPPMALLLKVGESEDYKVVANIPYYITSAVLRHFLENLPRPKLMVLMVQKEVALRIVAQPPHMNLLALSVQLYAKPEILEEVSPSAFYPTPKVASAVVRVTTFAQSPYGVTNYAFLFRLARTCFQQARKQVAGTLARKLGIDRSKVESIMLSLGLAPNSRPQELSVDQWVRLTEAMASFL